MPLVTIQSFAPNDPNRISPMIEDIRESSARALRCPISNIWVVFQPIAPGHYAQGEGAPVRSPQPKSHPAIVIIRANVGRTSAEREALASAVAEGVGRGLSIPSNNVWVHYQEMNPQDIWFKSRWSA